MKNCMDLISMNYPRETISIIMNIKKIIIKLIEIIRLIRILTYVFKFHNQLSRINIADANELAEAAEAWRGASGGTPLQDDLPIFKRIWDNMLRMTDRVSRTSGAWLNALLVSSLGTLLNFESFRLVIALRVGADVCIPHYCRSSGRMDSRGLHTLSCIPFGNEWCG